LAGQTPVSNRILGIFCAVGVIFIWSGFIVFSRAGVITSLTAYDITALRFMVAGLVVAPFVWSWWPRHLPFRAVVVMAICGPGAVYSMIMYHGLAEASAAYAGVFANGTLPVFTTILAMIFVREIPGRSQIIAIGFIVAGGVLSGFPGMTAGGSGLYTGIAMFLTASALLSFYVYGLKHWQVTPKQALALVTIPNAILFLPVWYFALPSGLADTDISMVLFQALFQGLGPGFFAIIFFALAAIHLGPTPTAGFSAAVPACASVLAMPVLGEFPTPIEWSGIIVVTIGLGLLIIKRQKV
jgi:drug/metabolite transporter (DMT)-like permease